MKRSIKKYISATFITLALLVVNQLKGQVSASFSADATQGCAPKLIKFTDNSTGSITSWSWDFGNGATSAVQYPSTVYTKAGTYTVKLTVTGGSGTDTETKTAYITIFDAPNADFSIDTTQGCQGAPFNFTNASAAGASGAAITTYFWDFGDGNSSAAKDIQHSYTVAGQKTVSLRVTDANGCEDYKEVQNILLVQPNPKTDFSADKTSSCVVPFQVNFTNKTSGSNTTYTWDLGNGTTSATKDPSTTYNTSGGYDVKLVAINSVTGCKDSLTKPAFVNAGNNNVGFAPSQPQGCNNQALTFNLTGTGTPQSVLWDFGDGNSSNSTPGVNTYLNPGTYAVKLIVNFAGGCADTIVQSIVIDDEPIPSYSFNPKKSCLTPFNVTFTNNTAGNGSFWEFGDGDTSSQRNTIHTYNSQGPFIIKFTSISPGGCKATQIDTIDYAPEIKVKPTPRQVCAQSANLSFDYETDPVGATAFSWNFDDGNTDNVAKPTHNFANQGEYIVKLTVTYANGCTATGQDTVSIFTKPVPNFEADKFHECVKKTIRFTNKSTNFTAFEWDFGDGKTDSINVNPTHNYRNWAKILELPDSFDVKLTLWNGTCQHDTTITSYINIDPPLAWIETDNPEGLYCDTPAVVSFADVSRYVNPRDTVYRVWYFNDPYAHTVNFQQCTTDTKNNVNVGLNCNYSVDSLPTHTYSKFGDYNAQLWLFSHYTRCSDSINFKVRVRPQFKPGFVASKTTGCAPLDVDFEDTTKRSVEWFWDFGDPRIDGDTDIVQKTNYKYVLPGKFYPTLTATDADGCVTTVTQEMDVRGPRASFKTVGKLCPPDTVQFVDISQKTDTIIKWHWDFGDKANAPNDTTDIRHPKYSFSKLGTYLVTLTATDNKGCVNSISRIIEYAPPVPDFKVVPEVVCLGDGVNFQNYTKGGFTNKYHWRFGDGDTSNLLNPAHTYTDTGEYNIFLRVTRADGCQDSVTITNMVDIVKPEFDFTVNQSKGLCPPFTVVFNLAQTDDIEEWYWDFGDSTQSTISNPIHTYNTPGVFTVSLKVKSKGGCSDSLIKQDFITVGGPVGTFTFDPKQGCNPLDVNFKATTQDAVIYTWDYGDGNVDYLNVDSAKHTYRQNGVFKPVLILTDSNNCTLTYTNEDSIYTNSSASASFSADFSEVCVGGSVNFTDNSQPSGAIIQRNWEVDSVNEGTGTTAFQHQFNDTGEHYVRLIITDTIGCNNDTQMVVQVKSLPVINISNDTAICFGNNAQLWVNGGFQYKWTPSNSTIDNDTLANPTVKPLTTTTYTVTVKSGAGCPDVNKNVTVSIWSLPSIEAGAKQFLCKGDTVQLTATGANDYTWEYSPFLSDTSASTTLAYPPAATYFKVYGTDTNGCTYYDSVQVEPIVAPKPDIVAPPKVCYGSNITLTATGGDSFIWNTGDTTPTIQRKLFTDETFWVSSSLQGCFGGYDTSAIEVDNSVFGVDFTLAKDTFYTGEKLELTNNSFGAVYYKWFTSNGKGPYFDSIPDISFRSQGNYRVTLIAESATGCIDSAVRSLIVAPDFIYFPTAFTPNGDFVNDLYLYVASYELKSVDFKVFDRWGEQIFYSRNQQNMWDGTYKGVPVPDGVYMYMFQGQKHTGDKIIAKGTITLIR